MQQTRTYNLKLIDTDDPFSPDALNENTQAVEDALVTHEAVVDGELKSQKLEWQARADALAQTGAADKNETDAALAAIAANLGTGGYNCRIKFGSYKGSGKFGPANPTKLTFDFCPVLVIIGRGFSAGNSNVHFGMMMRDNGGGVSFEYSKTLSVKWTDNGVSWYCAEESSGGSANAQMNISDTYYYVVLGYNK